MNICADGSAKQRRQYRQDLVSDLHGCPCIQPHSSAEILHWRERVDQLVGRMAEPDTQPAEIAANRSADQLFWPNGSVSNPNAAIAAGRSVWLDPHLA
jgi:hypothetical protein